MSSYTLPQNDTTATRSADLETMRGNYGYNYDYGLPISTKVDEVDKGGQLWTVKLLKAMYMNRANTDAIFAKTGWKSNVSLPEKSPLEIAKFLKEKNLMELFNYYLPDCGYFTNGTKARSLEDYKALFQRVDPIDPMQNALKDDYFAHSFTAGPNPNMLKKVAALPEKFPVTNQHFTSTDAFAGDSLADALSSGRVYMVDYEALSLLESGKHPSGANKYIYQPMMLFARPKSSDLIQAVAIQCGQDPRAYPVFTPDHDWGWTMAKTIAWIAHYAYHEVLTHLGFTHLLMEPIAVATHRHLHVTHPISGLITPHFEGTLPINYLAVTRLIQPGQSVDRLLGSSKETNYALLAKERLNYSFSGNFLPTRMQTNGVAAKADLPVYHYRDDGLQIWNAIHAWASDYVSIYYRDDATVRADTELQAWAAEIAASKGGSVKDFAANGGVNDRAQLIDTCTMIIFTSGPQHAAVNFSQHSDMIYLPAAPMSGYRAAPSLEGMTEKDYLDLLPPLDVAIKQIQTLEFLGTVNYSQLGFYAPGHFLDPRVLAALVKFQANLAKVEADIVLRNKSRRPYTHLLPSRIPQSTNI